MRPSKPLSVRSIDDSFAGTAPTTKEHLAVYCATVLNVKLPYPSCGENHQSPLDALWAAYADEDYFAIWHAMRGSGKTYMLVSFLCREFIQAPIRDHRSGWFIRAVPEMRIISVRVLAAPFCGKSDEENVSGKGCWWKRFPAYKWILGHGSCRLSKVCSWSSPATSPT